MSKILLINGSPHEKGCTYTALSEVAASLHACGVETELLWLGTQPVAGCIACGKCYDTGRCVFDDKVNDLLARSQEFDGMVVGSPVYYAGPAGQLCAFFGQAVLRVPWLLERKDRRGSGILPPRRRYRSF